MPEEPSTTGGTAATPNSTVVVSNGIDKESLAVIEIIRHSIRPFLTVWLALVDTILVSFLIIWGLNNGKMDIKEAIILGETTIFTPFAMILTYHFSKASSIDPRKNGNGV